MPEKQGNRVSFLGIDDLAGGERYPGGAFQVWVTVQGLEGWEVGVTVPLSGEGAYGAAELIVRPIRKGGHAVVPDGGVQARTLRAIPVAEILRSAFRNGPVGSYGWYVNSLEPTVAKAVVQTATGGRPRVYSKHFYAQVALDWEAQTIRGGGALGRLAADRGEPQSTVKNWIKAASDEGFLHKAAGRGPRPRRATQLARDTLEHCGEKGDTE